LPPFGGTEGADGKSGGGFRETGKVDILKKINTSSKPFLLDNDSLSFQFVHYVENLHCRSP
jgi:hypothetical protein